MKSIYGEEIPRCKIGKNHRWKGASESEICRKCGYDIFDEQYKPWLMSNIPRFKVNRKIVIKRQLHPIFFDIQEIVKSGNGAVIYIPKRFVGKKAYIIIEGD